MLSGMKKTIRVPVSTKILGDNESITTKNWWIEMNVLPNSKIKEIMERSKDPEDDYDDFNMLQEAVCGWGDLHDNEGNEVPFNDDNLWGVSEATPYKVSMVTAVFEAWAGGKKKNKAKN